MAAKPPAPASRRKTAFGFGFSHEDLFFWNLLTSFGGQHHRGLGLTTRAHPFKPVPSFVWFYSHRHLLTRPLRPRRCFRGGKEDMSK
jgi:hypothetical protein